ncbi:hypothetical protein VTN49DRAFT_4103 [Thermomyces lanuginosus]|uniref:uncharacterized protein n=1 Tax=Thermomyces lanuginosus TaxID=5541 RepID=UPI003743D956
MTAVSIKSLCLLWSFLVLVLQAHAALDKQLTGTWSSKSRQVITGPGFYDPIEDRLKEPPLTGISYSFSDDGYFEEAYYRAISEPSNPECPKAVMQWQHGTYSVKSNGSLVLTPFASDGRQLFSDPCAGDTSVYTRYNQTERFRSYRISTDAYHGVLRLDLEQIDGAPIQPLYIVYRQPKMLPTTTLDATYSATSTSDKLKRSTVEHGPGRTPNTRSILSHADIWWWFGLVVTCIGGILLVLS